MNRVDVRNGADPAILDQLLWKVIRADLERHVGSVEQGGFLRQIHRWQEEKVLWRCWIPSTSKGVF